MSILCVTFDTMYKSPDDPIDFFWKYHLFLFSKHKSNGQYTDTTGQFCWTILFDIVAQHTWIVHFIFC